ncbi:hypothetical protein EDI_004480 [Entamoeba dispar SAW760]|uniref:Uncharacterized protein n=1 Tax=Entamoeba dispar (strain ATCC PRA-260 / SAW760) TaxID=370354 RepID=B0E8Y4_ENTDS|nr:uncharacterized protein EDI_004480 [Entamoeba dispar SAW760]EDR28998.1 hypothetical protein EDI_004480 [Entamoeba dispar SAW760]|eukprot:EDR28998.1 hypothetical protein EDI_004480 [Entamoeba dispar SAW760]
MKSNEERKPKRFTQSELSEFSQSQVIDIVSRVRKSEGKFTQGEKEIKKNESQKEGIIIDPERISSEELRVKNLMDKFKTTDVNVQSIVDEQNKLRSIMSKAFHGENYEIIFNMTNIDYMEEIDGQWECCVSVKVSVKNTKTGVIHENIGSASDKGIDQEVVLKDCEKKAKVNGLYRSLQLFGISTSDFYQQYRSLLLDTQTN